MPFDVVQSIISQCGPLPFATLGLALDIVLAGAVKAIPPKRAINSGSLAKDIAHHAAGHFEFFTGRKAAPGRDRITRKPNAFEEFLAAVFDALGVEASAEFEAKKLRSREKTKQK